MKAHLIDTHLLVPRSRSSAKAKVKYQGHVSEKMGVSRALVFHKHILFDFAFFPFNHQQMMSVEYMRFIFIRLSKTGRIMGSPLAGGRRPHSLSGAYLQDYASYGYEILWWIDLIKAEYSAQES